MSVAYHHDADGGQLTRIDMNAITRAVEAHMLPGEEFRLLLPVILPQPDTGRGLIPAVIVPLYWAVRTLMRRGAVKRVQELTDLPLRDRMLWATTDQRVLIFAMDRRRILGELLGAVDRTDITGTTAAPTVGQGWRTVTFEFSNRPDLRVRVPARYLEPVLGGFPRRQSS